MMTPVPLLAALAFQKVRSLMGYQTEGRCPVAVSAEPNEMVDMKDSESKQKLVKDAEANDGSKEGLEEQRIIAKEEALQDEARTRSAKLRAEGAEPPAAPPAPPGTGPGQAGQPAGDGGILQFIRVCMPADHTWSC